jgi:hypothetical protein
MALSKVKQRLAEMGLNEQQQNTWLHSSVKALDPEYKENTTPQSLIDAGKADIVLALLDEIENGQFSL